MNVGHLGRRFFGSLNRKRPRGEAQWLFRGFSFGERELWNRMSPADQRHAVIVADRVRIKVGKERCEAEPWLMSAAAFHDIGKVESGLGTFGRVVATLVGRTLSRGRYRTYFRHPEVGGRLLRAAGSDERAALWAEDHHKPHDQWRIPWSLGMALKAADDD